MSGGKRWGGKRYAYIKTGDDYVAYGEAPWISEMYGYVFAASEAGIDTYLQHGMVQYTDATSDASYQEGGAAIIHYGLHCHVNSYHFTKCKFCAPSGLPHLPPPLVKYAIPAAHSSGARNATIC